METPGVWSPGKKVPEDHPNLPPWQSLPADRADTWEEKQFYVRVGAEPNQENLVLLWPRKHDSPPPKCQLVPAGRDSNSSTRTKDYRAKTRQTTVKML
jgi:hypothetical protein